MVGVSAIHAHMLVLMHVRARALVRVASWFRRAGNGVMWPLRAACVCLSLSLCTHKHTCMYMHCTAYRIYVIQIPSCTKAGAGGASWAGDLFLLSADQ